jgi:hypothetical protein
MTAGNAYGTIAADTSTFNVSDFSAAGDRIFGVVGEGMNLEYPIYV